MNRQDGVLVVGVGRFDLTGERRFSNQLGFGLENGSRDRSRHDVEHRVWSDEAVGDGEGCHRIIGGGRPPSEGPGGHVDRLEAGKPLVDGVRLVDGEDAGSAFGRELDGADNVDDLAWPHRADGEDRHYLLVMNRRPYFSERQENSLHRTRRNIVIAQDRIEGLLVLILQGPLRDADGCR